MFGFVEVILLALGLSNFGLQPNPKPPTPDAALQYAMADADVVLHVDAVTFVPNNFKALKQLADQPQVKASPELSKMMRQLVAELDGARGMAKSMVGIDPTTDVTDATISLQILPRQDPAFVAAVRGKFAPASIEKIAKLTGAPATKIGGGLLVEMGSQPAVALTKDGVLLAGTAKLLRERLADTWRAPARAAGTSLAAAADLIATKPVFGVAVALSPTARKAALDDLGPKKNFLSDAINRHKALTFAIYSDGVGWTWIDRDRAGLDAMAQMSEGMIELMRAANIAPRGMAKILMGGLESYRGTQKAIDEILARKADIMKIVESFTGDGNFKVKIDKNPQTLRLDVRATGKTLSEVLPAAMVLPLGGLAMFTVRGGGTQTAPPPPPQAMPPGQRQPAEQKQPGPGQKQPAPKQQPPQPRP